MGIIDIASTSSPPNAMIRDEVYPPIQLSPIQHGPIRPNDAQHPRDNPSTDHRTDHNRSHNNLYRRLVPLRLRALLDNPGKGEDDRYPHQRGVSSGIDTPRRRQHGADDTSSAECYTCENERYGAG